MAVSTIDLNEKPTATTSWWCLFRSLSEMGHEVTVLPFLGRTIKSPWWRAEDNPSRRLSKIVYSRGRELSKFPRIKSFYASHYGTLLRIPRLIISRNWKDAIDDLIVRDGKPDVVIFFSVPLNLLSDVPSHVRENCLADSSPPVAEVRSDLNKSKGLVFSSLDHGNDRYARARSVSTSPGARTQRFQEQVRRACSSLPRWEHVLSRIHTMGWKSGFVQERKLPY